MFIERPASKSINRTYFGAAGAMPVGTLLKVGDFVTLMQAEVSIEAKVTAVLAGGAYRGMVEAISALQLPRASVTHKTVELAVGEIVEFAERHVYRCTHRSI